MADPVSNNRTAAEFRLSSAQLQDIAHTFAERLREGLSHDERELRCLPTYLPSLEALPEDGECYVLDVGGTNVRAAIVACREGRFRLLAGPAEASLPRSSHGTMARERFFDIQQQVLESLGDSSERPLGYCFSYPAEPTLGGDMRLLAWTKEIEVDTTVGKPIGALLMDHLQRNSAIRCSRMFAVNDAVACMLSGLTGHSHDAYVGLVVGTGFNIATLIAAEQVTKLSTTIPGSIPINLESGNFTPPWLTPWDEIVDAKSHDRGRQRLEKAVSGGYLGAIAEAAIGDQTIPDAAALAQLLAEPQAHSSHSVAVAREVTTRAASLVAASLAGLAIELSRQRELRSIGVTAEGGLFWGRIGSRQFFAESTTKALARLRADLHLSTRFEIARREHANLIGTAIAVFQHDRKRQVSNLDATTGSTTNSHVVESAQHLPEVCS